MIHRLEADVAREEPKLQAARTKRDVLAQEAKALQQKAEQIESERDALFKQNRQSRFHTKVQPLMLASSQFMCLASSCLYTAHEHKLFVCKHNNLHI